MQFILDGIQKGIHLTATLDPQVMVIVKLSLFVSALATAIAVVIAVPLGSLIAIKKFSGKKLAIALINTGMGLPPVVVGLVVTLFLSRYGPLGFLHWLYTPIGMVLAQVIIATPIITGLSMAAVQSVEQKFFLQIIALGATTRQALWIVLKEIRLSVLAAVIAGFGSIISEVGAVMMVGGNIKGQTRVLTTAVVLETHMGNIDIAIALSLILLTMSFIVNLTLTFIQQRKAR
ncbi:MAG: ABC transporter permease [Candidatus Omnitrophica bacterium]|nr:ABC transporter permease [Candidatus Omnitrophota bacterium]